MSKSKTKSLHRASRTSVGAQSPLPLGDANLFCQRADLFNEATVEQFFASRLLAALGYKDRNIKPKSSLDTLTVNEGRRGLKYKPDYALLLKGKIRWIVEAKATTEPIDKHIGQCAGYCLALNSAFEDANPVRYYLITNGINSALYEWDRNTPVVELTFDDFAVGNPKYERLVELVSASSKTLVSSGPSVLTHTLRRVEVEDVNSIFAWCHQFIHRKDALSQSDAFMEFMKIIFLKLLSDKEIHEAHPEFASADEIKVPADEVKFSKRWIEQRERDHANPLDALQFQTLLTVMEEQIRRGKKKRIFPAGDHIQMKAETISGVIAKLEGIDLYGIDADLNGRLFETFLNATMRGKDLGQYFTPRSVVKLAVRLANIKVGRDKTEAVLDACCGTGGFLIDALAEMWKKVAANTSLSARERTDLQELIATKRVYGIDVARGPALARIARMNMYLHGDGGGSIYQADALDKKCLDERDDSPEVKAEKAELRALFSKDGFADVVLTNPPFAKETIRGEGKRDAQILDGYELAFDVADGKRRPKPKLKSSMMFLERYKDFLVPGGRMVTVIDDSILGNREHNQVRDFIKAHFIVRAVVSLPGDAFQRSNARVKTSLLVLERKRDLTDVQPDVFMRYCTVVGLDDPSRKRVLPIDKVNRKRALAEVEEIGKAYELFLAGDAAAKKWTVPGSAIADRMDVKNCALKANKLVPKWQRAKVSAPSLSEWVDVLWPLPPGVLEHPDIVDPSEAQTLQYLKVRYDGFAEPGDEKQAAEGQVSLYYVHTDNIAISNINVVNGAVAVVPASLDGAVVTNEYTICRAKAGIDPRVIWMLLRSPEMRANLLILATGIGRTRVRWEQVATLRVPQPAANVANTVTTALAQAEALEAQAAKLRSSAQQQIESPLNLNNDDAKRILAAFKPPQ